MKQHSISNGHTIRLHGEAAKTVEESPTPATAGVSPLDFPGMKPRLLVKKGDSVKRGTPLIQDKTRPEIVIVSPVAGSVSDIVYGPRRALERVVVQESSSEAESFGSMSAGSISSENREALIQRLLKSGMWAFLRQRPFDRIANPEAEVSSIFINGMDTAPLGFDHPFALETQKEELQAGIDALKVLAGEKKVYFSVDARQKDSFFAGLKNVELHAFKGKHPAGLVSTHIEQLDPIHQGKSVWYVNATHAALIGKFLLTGSFPERRIIALAGEGVERPSYMRILPGARVGDILRDRLRKEPQRIITGNILTGRKISEDDFCGFYDDIITVLPEGGERHFLGWLMPGFSASTATRLFASSFLPPRAVHVNASLNGEERALVMTGTYKKYMSLDIYPDFLVKAILSEDLEMMEQLGLLESAPEDFALCSFICPSKTEFTEIIRKGLDLFEAETT